MDVFVFLSEVDYVSGLFNCHNRWPITESDTDSRPLLRNWQCTNMNIYEQCLSAISMLEYLDYSDWLLAMFKFIHNDNRNNLKDNNDWVLFVIF